MQTATRSIARSGIGSVVGALAGPQTVVQATGPVSGDSVFQIGSVTKVFTSLALADAVVGREWLQVGLGWFLSPIRSSGHTALWHNGGTGGFASYVALMPTANAGVVVLADRARSVDRPGLRLISTLTETARHV